FADNEGKKLLKQQVEQTKKNVQEYETAMKEFDALKQTLNDPSLGTNKDKKESEQKTPIEQHIVDTFKASMAGMDAQIKQSQLDMADYVVTSKEYRDELDKQIDLMQQKQNLSHEEANRLRGVDTELNKQIDSLGNWNSMTDKQKEQYNK